MEKVVLWVPTATKRPESWLCVDTYLRMNVPEGYQMIWKRGLPGNIQIVWNQVVKDFLASDCTWLWSVHDDVVFSEDTLERLLSWNQPLVSALIFHRHSPVLPHIWKQFDNGYAQMILETRKWFLNRPNDIKFGPYIINPRPDDALIESGFTSTSCTLIHRKVLEAMREEVKELWFKLDFEYGGGEDRNFFEHARIAGYQNYVDRSCIAGHIVGDVPTSTGDFMMWTNGNTFTGTGEDEFMKSQGQVKLEMPVK